MRKDTSFSDRKLTVEEFSDKYWKGGQLPYQYHTAGIEDGRDEREQFVFNNIRALKELLGWYMGVQRREKGELEARIAAATEELQIVKRRAIWAGLLTIILIILALISLFAMLLRGGFP